MNKISKLRINNKIKIIKIFLKKKYKKYLNKFNKKIKIKHQNFY